jgi:serine/threonine protein kinase
MTVLPLEPLPERVLAGRYRLLEPIGRGGMSVVWRAEDLLLRRLVAVKELTLPRTLPPREIEVLRERLMREARAACAVLDPAAVTVHDVVEEAGTPYLVMELVRARTLAQAIADRGPLSIEEVAQIGIALLGALAAAHRADVVHRDVKPGNVLLTDDGRAMLTDFGIAATTTEIGLTEEGVLLGSPAYVAPERARGAPGGPESDLWSLGSTLYSAVEGTPAFEGADQLATLHAVAGGGASWPGRSLRCSAPCSTGRRPGARTRASSRRCCARCCATPTRPRSRTCPSRCHRSGRSLRRRRTPPGWSWRGSSCSH